MENVMKYTYDRYVAKSGICPLCGTELNYQFDDVMKKPQSNFVWIDLPWTCEYCGATGIEYGRYVFIEHWDMREGEAEQ